MRLIKQRDYHDCGVATAAMLTGCNYKTAFAVAKDLITEDGIYAGLSSGKFIEIVNELSGLSWTLRKGRKKPLVEFELPERAGIVIRPESRSWGHWIAVEGGRIFDPDYDRAVHLRAYRRRRWGTILIAEPTP